MHFIESNYIIVEKYGILKVLYRIFDRCSAVLLLFLIMKQLFISDRTNDRVN